MGVSGAYLYCLSTGHYGVKWGLSILPESTGHCGVKWGLSILPEYRTLWGEVGPIYTA